ncbi:MAG: cytochrome c3 family protein [bacterium]|nr:cytochrome c3 family protein [bacterium]
MLRNKPKLILTALGLLLSLSLILKAFPPATLEVPPSDIIFSHQFHVGDQEIDCESCHTEISSSDKAATHNLPTMDECSACHDVEDDETCGICHRNSEEPSGFSEPERSVLFNHARHLENEITCQKCHAAIATSEKSSSDNLPKMALCMNCHDGGKLSNDCALCHGDQLVLEDIHPSGWKNEHGDRAAVEREWCTGCHRGESSCLECHRGDNLNGNIHDLNYRYTHGLEAKGKSIECSRCHENKQFCVSCHENEIRMPLRHSLLSWRTNHGLAARMDVENCAACHEAGETTCARSGCHTDRDGIRGTDNKIHDADAGRFSFGGEWHDDNSYFCYQCHTNTNQRGDRFCGYCHN